MANDSKGPNPNDIYVGRRVRLRRKEVGLSQEKLADGLGLTFQQIQKYERGTNRISASKLLEIGKILGVAVSYFFEGLEDPAGSPSAGYAQAYQHIIESLLAEPNGRELAEAFLNIKRRSIKKALADIAREIANSEIGDVDDDGEGGDGRLAAE